MPVWIDDMCQRVEQLCREHGWDLTDGEGYAGWKRAQTRSRYAEASRVVIDSEGDEGQQTVRVRVSDHATCYTTEDVSLVPPTAATPDDHGLADLRRILSGPPVADSGYNPARLPGA